MKKFLLVAAVAAMTLSASAQTLTESWKVETKTALTKADVRQGIGIRGKYYINHKTEKAVYVVDKDGFVQDVTGAALTLPGGANCGISKDEAGNLVIANNAFPNAWGETANLLVYSPAEPTTVTTIEFSEDLDMPNMGRSDFIGMAKGNLMEDGEILIVGANSGIRKVVVTEGELDVDNSYVALCEGLSFANMAVVNYIGDDQYLFVNRSGKTSIIEPEGDNYAVVNHVNFQWNVGTQVAPVFPEKGSACGAQIFTLGDHNYIIYPTGPNYLDAFAISDLDKDLEIVASKEAGAVSANGFQADWLNVEVISNTEANIYQYFPGEYVAMYTFKTTPTAVNDVNVANAKTYKTIEDGQVVIVKGDARYNVMGQEVK